MKLLLSGVLFVGSAVAFLVGMATQQSAGWIFGGIGLIVGAVFLVREFWKL